MARKSKNMIKEEDNTSPLIPSEEEQKVVIEMEDAPVTVTMEHVQDEATTTVTYESELPHTSAIEAVIKLDCKSYSYEEMNWASSEIERCNDYIYAKADSSRRFATYRDELYEYRYKIRQLAFNPNYPNIEKSKFPPRPDYVPDE